MVNCAYRNCGKRFYRSTALNDASDMFCSYTCRDAEEAAMEKEMINSPMTDIDLDELERAFYLDVFHFTGLRKDGLRQLIALARKGLENGALQMQYNALYEYAGEQTRRADEYERALREIEPTALYHPNADLGDLKRAIKRVVNVARAALDKFKEK